MQLLIPKTKDPEFEAKSKAEVLNDIEPVVEELMTVHLQKRKLWFPSDFIPADEAMAADDERQLQKLRDRAKHIPDSARVALAMNLITEEGLPHFHRLLATYLGQDSFWHKWNYMWTAEEDRHGCILRDYVRDTRLFKFREIEQMQYVYQETGFNPDWDNDPYKVFAYTTVQERATQISHRNTGKAVGEFEPLLESILNNVAADEAKHYHFYRRIFKEIILRDPNRALQSAIAILPAIDMPGYGMPNFKSMAEIISRIGIYGAGDYKRIVEEAIEFWNIDVLTGLSEIGQKLQDKIMAIPSRLQKVAEYIEGRATAKSFAFDFIYNRTLAIG